MRTSSLALPIAAIGLVMAARAVGVAANHERRGWPEGVDEPYVPSPSAAPYVTLGYRELAADLLWIRGLTYFGSDDGASTTGVQNIIAAIAALDPQFEEPMSWGALAMWSVSMKVTQDDYLRIIELLEAAMVRFPDNYRLAQRAGEIYALRLHSDDPAQRRAWKLAGATLLSRAVRLPGAPKSLGTYVAHLQTELGQRDKAIRDLRELVLYTTDPETRQKLIAKLAKLTATSSDTIAYELDVERRRFEEAWKRDRPELSAAMYAVMGPAIEPWFDPTSLSDPEIHPIEPIEPLPPLSDHMGEILKESSP